MPKKILLITDDPSLERLFQLYEHEVQDTEIITSDPKNGLLKLDEISPDVVCVDYNLKGNSLSAPTIISYIRDNHHWARLAIVLVNPYGDTLRNLCGADAMLTKHGFSEITKSIAIAEFTHSAKLQNNPSTQAA